MEAMKMEHHVSAPDDGVVIEIFVSAGEQVHNGTALLVIEPAGAEAASDAVPGER
jgi:biotin carboxyl carrier protein